jgi:hypothetical protein
MALTVEAQPMSEDQKQIVSLFENTYVEVMCKKGDPQILRKFFHPEFRMYTYYQGDITVRTLDEWIPKLESNRGKSKMNRWNFSTVLVTGTTALVKVEFFIDKEIQFTDFFSLYKLDDDWKVFTKTFHIH